MKTVLCHDIYTMVGFCYSTGLTWANPGIYLSVLFLPTG